MVFLVPTIDVISDEVEPHPCSIVGGSPSQHDAVAVGTCREHDVGAFVWLAFESRGVLRHLSRQHLAGCRDGVVLCSSIEGISGS